MIDKAVSYVILTLLSLIAWWLRSFISESRQKFNEIWEKLDEKEEKIAQLRVQVAKLEVNREAK